MRERRCDSCGAPTRNESDVICPRCGGAIVSVTPTGVHQRSAQRWVSDDAGPGAPAATLIGMPPPRVEVQGGARGGLSPVKTETSSAPKDMPQPGLPTIPVERLPASSLTPTPLVEMEHDLAEGNRAQRQPPSDEAKTDVRPDPSFADTQRPTLIKAAAQDELADTQRPTLVKVAAQEEKASARGIAYTLPPGAAEAQSEELSRLRTDPDQELLSAMDGDVTPPPLVEEEPASLARVVFERRDRADLSGSLEEGFSDSTSRVDDRSVPTQSRGVSGWLLALWIVAIAAAVAAALVFFFR